MRQTYNEATATRLIPLLSGIATEYIDRARSIRRLERRLESQQASDEEQAGILETTAQLSLERRGQRYCCEEVEHLGCEFEAGRTVSVLIPATGGKQTLPWRWRVGDRSLRQTQHVVPAA
ncbi:MAG TPA: DUF2203 family protein [Planctomycetes bacterium]|nr:DUF2203 family protein [Planctomycetota bacterium]HIL38075.1 DUF2203 family protein [Planctomycetota bacterium]